MIADIALDGATVAAAANKALQRDDKESLAQALAWFMGAPDEQVDELEAMVGNAYAASWGRS